MLARSQGKLPGSGEKLELAKRVAGSAGQSKHIPQDAGIWSIARFLNQSVNAAETAERGIVGSFLERADEAVGRLLELAGGSSTGSPDEISKSSRGLINLRDDAHAIEKLAACYVGARRLPVLHRIRYGATSIGVLSRRLKVQIELLQAALGNAPEEPMAQDISVFEEIPGDWSPMFGAPADSFARIQRETHCTFARKSTIWTAPQFNTGTISGIIPAWARALRGFTRAMRVEPLDGFLMPLPREFGENLDSLATTTRQILAGLAATDGPMRCDLRRAGRPDWYFRFAGERFFLITMAPCYGPAHARYSFDEPYTFLLLQPDRAFDRAVSPGSAGLISAAVRERIRERYRQNGRPYDLAITLAHGEALRFVKPLELGDPPVRWWEAQAGAAAGEMPS
jgi:hypothetical protein